MRSKGLGREIHPARTGVGMRLMVAASIAALLGMSCYGTLILTVPTGDGMLVVSDKLLTMGHSGGANGSADGVEKVRLLSPTAAVGFAGLIGLIDGTHPETDNPADHLFAVDFAKYYFLTNRIDDFDGQKFAGSMGEQVSNYFGHLTMDYHGPPSDVCEFMVFRTMPGHERRTFVAYLTFALAATNWTVTSTQCKEYIQRDRDPAQIIAFGQPDLPAELEHGKDPRFDDLRNNWMISKFLPKPPLARDVGLADAELFAQCLMAAASEKTILLNTNAAIGSNIDETILTF